MWDNKLVVVIIIAASAAVLLVCSILFCVAFVRCRRRQKRRRKREQADAAAASATRYDPAQVPDLVWVSGTRGSVALENSGSIPPDSSMTTAAQVSNICT
jgi:hypothetical protein